MPQLHRGNLGFLLAKATQRWNERMTERFGALGYPEVRASYGSVLIPLFERDGLRLGDIAERSAMSKQSMTTLVRNVEQAGLVRREPDPQDARACRVHLTAKARKFAEVADLVLAELEAEAHAIAGPESTTAVLQWLQRFASKP